MTPADPAARLAANRAEVLERVRRASLGAGRDGDAVCLLAVTKSVSPAVAALLVDLGQTDLGENRLPVLDAKLDHFATRPPGAPRPRWHFIGHVQRNKARRVVERVDVLHAVHSLALLDAVARIAAELGRRPEIYLQVKLRDEQAKHGLAPAELPAVVAAAAAHARAGNLELAGLMCMAPLCPDLDEAARRAEAAAVFEECATLAATLDGGAFLGGAPRLSMGMSGDLEEAVRAGSHVVRVGTALFAGLEPSGERSVALTDPEARG